MFTMSRMICIHPDICLYRANQPPFPRSPRAPVTRPVERDQPDAKAVQQLPARMLAQPASWRPVHQEDGNAIRIAEHLDSKPPPASRPHRVRQGIPSLESAPLALQSAPLARCCLHRPPDPGGASPSIAPSAPHRKGCAGIPA